MEKKTAPKNESIDSKKLNLAKQVAARQFLRFYKNGGHQNIVFKKTDDPTIYYFMFTGLGDLFRDGVYLGEIKITESYIKPPLVTMYTPTGVYPVNTHNFCISIGHYHANDYCPGIGIDGFVRCVLSGLENWRELGEGINLIATADSEENEQLIRRLATSSVEYNNTNNRHILAYFE